MATAQKKAQRDSVLLTALQDTNMKVYIETIAVDDARIKYMYEAPADTEHGQDCVRTVYVYVGTSDTVLYSREQKAIWDGQWDTDAEAKAVADGYTID